MNLYTSLLEAIQTRDASQVEVLLNQGANANYKIRGGPRKGQTLLYEAIFLREEPIVRLLLNKGAKVDVTDSRMRTPFYQAVKTGILNIIALLLEAGSAINHQDNMGVTPLHEAVLAEKEATVRLLLDRGANIHIRDNRGCSPLHRATNHPGIIALLLDKGASINSQESDGNTLLHLVVAKNTEAFQEAPEAIVELLLNKGAKLDVKNKVGRTPLNMETSHTGVLKLLLQHGAYSYPYNQAFNFLSYNESLVVHHERELAFYTALLLAGVPVPLGKELPEPLALRKRAIEETIFNWLSPLELSEDTCRAATPNILRALPRLLYWMEKIKAVEIKLKRVSQGYGQPNAFFENDRQALANIMLTSEVERDNSKRVVHLRKKLLFQKMDIDLLPEELVLLIQEKLVQQVLVDNLTTYYPMPHEIADYVAAEVMESTAACAAFNKEIFQHDWELPCKVPATRSMQRSTKAFMA